MQAPVTQRIDVPVVETERLRLRGHRADDFAACAANWADPAVIRYTTGKPLTPEEAWSKMVRNAGLWPVLGYGYWAVEEKASGDFVGEAGFADFKREMEPSVEGIPEAGWILSSRVHGKGYGTEVVRAIVAWADQQFHGARTVCLIHPENAASIRVAEKCGFREHQRTKYKEHDVILLERERISQSHG